MSSTNLEELLQRIVAFRDDRDWKQFHNLRNLAAAIAIEAAELQQELLWKTDAEASAMLADPATLERLGDEAADVLIFTLLLCHEAGIGPGEAIRAKLDKNAEKYPVDLARGSAKKYTDL